MIVAGIIIVIILAFFGLITFIGAPYVPTHKRQITKVFTEAYEITPDDMVIDLGSGDGVLLRAVARRGGRALGYELNPILWGLSILLSGRFANRISVKCRNFWTAKLPPETTLVYAFADGRSIGRIGRKLQAHAKRTGRPVRFMSYGFGLPNVTPDTEVGGMKLYTIIP